MSNETATALKSTKDTFTAKYNGGANSPNLPAGNWEFVLNADGDDVLIETLESKNERADGTKASYDVAYVTPKGQPDATRRRVYTSAFTCTTGQKILFNADGTLKPSGYFGIFSGTKDDQRTTTVSAKAEDVEKGIAAANAAYAQQRRAKADADAALTA